MKRSNRGFLAIFLAGLRGGERVAARSRERVYRPGDVLVMVAVVEMSMAVVATVVSAGVGVLFCYHHVDAVLSDMRPTCRSVPNFAKAGGYRANYQLSTRTPVERFSEPKKSFIYTRYREIVFIWKH